jgi:hypothetical protein
MEDWKWKVTKIGPSGEHSEELSFKEISELLLSAGFMTMVKRMKIGEEIFYNERNLKFQRIS